MIKGMKSLLVNISLVDDLLEMLGYAKFMKSLVTKKKSVDFEIVKVSHHCSVIISSSMVVKKDDTGEFTIPCTIGMY